MNWKLIFSLSLFGLAMAVATSFFLSVHSEVYVWPFIMIITAYFIAKNRGNYFSHGILTGLLNSIWIDIFHVIFFTSFMALNADMADKWHWPLAGHIRLNLVIVGLCIGLISGIVLGILAWLIGLVVNKKQAATTTE